MSSGNKHIQQNSRERAISDDINSIQDFIARDRSQALKRLFNRPSNNRSPLINPGLTPDISAVPAGATTGTVHDCLGGLMVRPDPGAYLLVDPGSAGFINPASPVLGVNDSRYVVVDSIGLQTAGVLAFTANASGVPRIDVVECQPVETVDTNVPRDILQLDGTIASINVDKVISTKLTFRIRVGTPGAGFPVVEQDWMPLAVVVVQSGAASFAQSDVYDVRPLVGERSNAFFTHKAMTSVGVPTTWDVGYSHARIHDRQIYPGTVLTDDRAYGYFIGEANGYRVGGQIRRNTPSDLADFGVAGDEAWVSTNEASNKLDGAGAPSATVGALNAIMALYPMGLGRWVRYSQAVVGTAPLTGQVVQSGARLPQGPNGIMVVGTPAVIKTSGEVNVLGGLALFGAGTAAQNIQGIIVGWSSVDGGGGIVVHTEGRRHTLHGSTMFKPEAMSVGPMGLDTAEFTSATVIANTGADLNTHNLAIPANARMALVKTVGVTVLSANGGRYKSVGPYATYAGVGDNNWPIGKGQSNGWLVGNTIEICHTVEARPGANLTQLVLSTLSPIVIDTASMTIEIVGWED